VENALLHAPCAGALPPILVDSSPKQKHLHVEPISKMRLTSGGHIDGPPAWARLGVPLSPCNTASEILCRKRRRLTRCKYWHCKEHVSSTAGLHAPMSLSRSQRLPPDTDRASSRCKVPSLATGDQSEASNFCFDRVHSAGGSVNSGCLARAANDCPMHETLDL
jgi:hypothetical protein